MFCLTVRLVLSLGVASLLGAGWLLAVPQALARGCLLLETLGNTGVCVALAAPLLAKAQPARPADVIVILGRDGRERMNLGAELYLAGFAPRIVLFNSSLHYLPHAAQLRPALLQVDGPRDTWAEARHTARLARQYGWHRILVISDPPHLRRVHWLFKKECADKAELVLVATRPTWWQWPSWWHSQYGAGYVQHELASLLYHQFRVGG